MTSLKGTKSKASPRVWTLTTTAVINDHFEAVVSWWRSEARSELGVEELRGRLPDLALVKSVTDTSRVTEITWSTPRFGKAFARTETPLEPSELSDRRYQASATNLTRLPTRRGEIVTQCDLTIEITSTWVGLSDITLEHRHVKTGGSWWERYLPPIAERAQLNKRLLATTATYRRPTDGSDGPDGSGGRQLDATSPIWTTTRSLIAFAVLLFVLVTALLSQSATHLHSSASPSPSLWTGGLCVQPTIGGLQDASAVVQNPSKSKFEFTWYRDGRPDRSDPQTHVTVPGNDPETGERGDVRYTIQVVPTNISDRIDAVLTYPGGSESAALIAEAGTCSILPTPSG